MTYILKKNWTQEQREAVLTLWNKGLSASAIAPLFGTTKNAIIGIVHRWPGVKRRGGWAYRTGPRKVILKPSAPVAIAAPRTVPVAAAKPVAAAPKPATARLQPTALVFIAARSGGILDVTGCRWPVMADASVIGGQLFCNADRYDQKSYCPRHEARSVRPRDAT